MHALGGARFGRGLEIEGEGGWQCVCDDRSSCISRRSSCSGGCGGGDIASTGLYHHHEEES